MHGVAGKYATSLYVAAVQAKALEPIYEELNQVLKAAEKSPTFREFMKDMSVSNKDRVKAVRTLFEELECSEISINFLGNAFLFHICLKVFFWYVNQRFQFHVFKKVLSSSETIYCMWSGVYHDP